MQHNDRKSRHRRIKKQRRYVRLAATSQFLYTDLCVLFPERVSGLHVSGIEEAVHVNTVSSGSSPYLKHRSTHVLPSVEPPSRSRVGC